MQQGNEENVIVRTNVIKRNGQEVTFDITKIINAIGKANHEVAGIHQMNNFQIRAIADNIAKKISNYPHAANVEDIQDMVETGIMEMRGYEVAQKYVRYRYKREISRKSNTTDDGILSLIELNNEEVKQENSNKNPVINSTQRDYMAGEVSKDLTRRLLLPEEIVKAHDEGIIHFHDARFYHILDIFDISRVGIIGNFLRDIIRNRTYLEIVHLMDAGDFMISFADSIDDFRDIESDFLPVSFDDIRADDDVLFISLLHDYTPY